MTTAAPIVGESDPRVPAVSVIIPALNSARTIGRCMRALAGQEGAPPFEVIVVHSGEDDTCSVAREVLPAARTVQLNVRSLAARARNVGVDVARAAVLAFVDSDAYVDPSWVREAARAAATPYDVVCGAIDNANPRSAVSRAEALVMFSEFLATTPERPIWFALAGNMVMRREAYERFGRFVEIRASEDIVYTRRLALAGGQVLFSPRLRVAHDNRQAVGPYLRNQRVLGRYTAMARWIVPFSDSASRAVFLALLPLAPGIKLAKIVWRLTRWSPRQLLTLLREFPLVLLGVCAHAVGTLEGAWAVVGGGQGTGVIESSTGGDGALVASIAPMSGREPDHGR